MTTIKYISAGFREILMSGGTQSAVESAAAAIAQRANASAPEGSDGYQCHTWRGSYGGGRIVASVASADEAAARAESEGKILSKAVTG